MNPFPPPKVFCEGRRNAADAGRSENQPFSDRQHYGLGLRRQPRPLQIVNGRFGAVRTVISDQNFHSISFSHRLSFNFDERIALY